MTTFMPHAYVDLLSIVRETNRCPGGKRTLARIAQRLNIGPGTRVLEIGSNTGFTSIELVKLTGCSARGIDVNPMAVAEADRWRERLPAKFADRLHFTVGDATAIPYDDASFDVIICGGANTFVQQRDAALAEYQRVLAPYGFVSITNLFYRRTPPAELLADLHAVLGFEVPANDLAAWLDVFLAPGFELFDLTTTDLTDRPGDIVDAYVEAICSPARLAELTEPELERVRESWRHVMHVFNRNHAFLGFMELTLRKEETSDAEQPELFLARGEFDRFFQRDFVR